MPTSYTTLLGLAKPATGELSGTWGTTVNNYITDYVDSAVAGAQVISGTQTAVTLSTTNGSSLTQAGSGSTGSAQYAIIRCTGNPAGLLTVTAPAANKVYLVINATSTSQSVKVVGTGPTTGVTIAASRAALIAWNGSDFVLIATTDIAQMSGFGTGVATALGQNVTGSGGIVLATSPTLVTPTLGAASATSVALAAGAAGTPSLTATGDLDTGLWFPAANTLAASTGGSERLRIDSSGNVGIGTTSPAGKLVVSANGATIVVSAADNATSTSASYQLTNSAGTIVGRTIYYGPSYSGGSLFNVGANGIAITQEANAPFAIGTYAVSQPLIFATSSNEQMRVTSGGDVGIGTTLPASKLSVYQASSVQIQATTGTIDFRVQCIDANGAAYVGSVSNHSLAFTTNNVTRLQIDTSGSQFSVNPGTSTLYPQYACRAWVNFDGSGGATIRAAGNVSSVTYGGTGIYTVNFSTAMPDANYSPQASVSNRTTAQNAITQFNTPSTSSIGMDNYEAGVRRDNSYIYVAVFR